jgi:ATP synthase protein I
MNPPARNPQPNPFANGRRLEKRIEEQARRMKRAAREKETVIGQSVYLGVLGVMFVLPVIAGAYLGQWLDSLAAGYSVRWSVGMILLGVIVGTVNVYLFVKD